MNIDTILVTTRLYYSIEVPPKDLVEINSADLISIAHLVQGYKQEKESEQMKKNEDLEKNGRANIDDFDPFEDDEDDEDVVNEDDSNLDYVDYNTIIRQLFIEEGSAEDYRSYNGYWEDLNSKLCLKRIIASSSGKSIIIYVAPCFPTNYDKMNLSIRHAYLKALFGKLLSSHSLLIAHDKDLYIENEERCLAAKDCISGSQALSEEVIPLCQVFGFQHVSDPNRLYSIFINKLGKLSYEDCLHAIEAIERDMNNRTIFDQIDNFPFGEDGKLKSIDNIEALTNLTNLIKSII